MPEMIRGLTGRWGDLLGRGVRLQPYADDCVRPSAVSEQVSHLPCPVQGPHQLFGLTGGRDRLRGNRCGFMEDKTMQLHSRVLVKPL